VKGTSDHPVAPPWQYLLAELSSSRHNQLAGWVHLRMTGQLLWLNGMSDYRNIRECGYSLLGTGVALVDQRTFGQM